MKTLAMHANQNQTDPEGYQPHRPQPAVSDAGNDSTAPTGETLYSDGDLSQQSLTFGLSRAGFAAEDPLVGVTVGDVTIFS